MSRDLGKINWVSSTAVGARKRLEGIVADVHSNGTVNITLPSGLEFLLSDPQTSRLIADEATVPDPAASPIFDYAGATRVAEWCGNEDLYGEAPLTDVADGWWLANPGTGTTIGFLWGKADTYDGLVELACLTESMGCQEVHAGERIVRIQGGIVTEIAGFPPGVTIQP